MEARIFLENYSRFNESIKKLSKDLRTFIQLSFQESESSWAEWLATMTKHDVGVRCWEAKHCNEKGCPAYKNTCGRCWLIAGTMCGGEVTGKYAQKYKNCCECDVYKEAVFRDSFAEVFEHVITLVHSLKSRQEELNRLATRDILTGLFNRNFFEMSVERDIENIRRIGGRPQFMMLDINNFKFVNDTYGHIQGDRILREAAGILNESVRTADLLVRLGGDEFLILLPAVTGHERDNLTKRIEIRLADWNREWATPDYSLSFSIGHSVLEPDTDFRQSLAEADADMYRQKAVFRARQAEKQGM